MFSGIIKSVGIITSFDHGSLTLWVCCPLFTKHDLGDSIAIDGVCLTVALINNNNKEILGFNLGKETINTTLLAQKHQGDLVNIEPALSLHDSVDGHLVQGHVDGIGSLIAKDISDEGQSLSIAIPKHLHCYVIHKGSIAIDGVSLTINEVFTDKIKVFLVPFTIKHTTLAKKHIPSLMHLESDIIGRYLYHFHYQRYEHQKEIIYGKNH
jgi:riboflavin synthase